MICSLGFKTRTCSETAAESRERPAQGSPPTPPGPVTGAVEETQLKTNSSDFSWGTVGGEKEPSLDHDVSGDDRIVSPWEGDASRHCPALWEAQRQVRMRSFPGIRPRRPLGRPGERGSRGSRACSALREGCAAPGLQPRGSSGEAGVPAEDPQLWMPQRQLRTGPCPGAA